MEKFNYAAKAKVFALGAKALARFALALLYVVVPVKDECVDYGGHKHPPDSMQSERILPVETKISPKYAGALYE